MDVLFVSFFPGFSFCFVVSHKIDQKKLKNKQKKITAIKGIKNGSKGRRS